MSPAAGQQRTGTPKPSALTTVPWPPWQTTRSAAGITWEYESQSTNRALGGTSIGVGGTWLFVVAITRTGSSARAASPSLTNLQSGSCDVLGAISTSGESPSR